MTQIYFQLVCWIIVWVNMVVDIVAMEDTSVLIESAVQAQEGVQPFKEWIESYQVSICSPYLTWFNDYNIFHYLIIYKF